MIPLVHNPASGGGRGAKRVKAARRALAERGVETRLVPTRGPGDAVEVARGLAASGEGRILAIGGDGTVSEVCEGALRSGARAALGFLPGGTGNDFLLHFGASALDDAAQRIADGKTRRVDAMRVRWAGGERHAVTVFGVGFMANVADLANRRLKRFGARAYTLAVFPQVARLRSPMTRLRIDDITIDEPFALVAVCNTRFAGGGMPLAPMADPEDGALEIIALRSVGRAKLALRMLPLLLRGAHVGHPDVFHASARSVRIEAEGGSPLLGDGEVYGAMPVDVDVLPGALDVLV